ncbi:MAG: tRNA (adenine-N(6)-)-methyltransferase [Calditrichia bacterium]
MKSYKQPPMKQGQSDDYQTPPNALYPLLPYLKREWTIWECANGQGNLTNELIKREFITIATDISHGHDFLKWQPDKFDCIITNPPYSLKQQFLQRCYQLGKPFALLLPLTTLETRKRQRLFEKYGVQLILFDKRINFETPDGNGDGSWFASAWFTWGLNLPKDLFFIKLEHPDQEKLV